MISLKENLIFSIQDKLVEKYSGTDIFYLTGDGVSAFKLDKLYESEKKY